MLFLGLSVSAAFISRLESSCASQPFFLCIFAPRDNFDASSLPFQRCLCNFAVLDVARLRICAVSSKYLERKYDKCIPNCENLIRSILWSNSFGAKNEKKNIRAPARGITTFLLTGASDHCAPLCDKIAVVWTHLLIKSVEAESSDGQSSFFVKSPERRRIIRRSRRGIVGGEQMPG